MQIRSPRLYQKDLYLNDLQSYSHSLRYLGLLHLHPTPPSFNWEKQRKTGIAHSLSTLCDWASDTICRINFVIFWDHSLAAVLICLLIFWILEEAWDLAKINIKPWHIERMVFIFSLQKHTLPKEIGSPLFYQKDIYLYALESYEHGICSLLLLHLHLAPPSFNWEKHEKHEYLSHYSLSTRKRLIQSVELNLWSFEFTRLPPISFAFLFLTLLRSGK